MVVTVLLAWFATSALLSPLIGMMLATCTREQIVSVERLAPARVRV